MQHTRRHIVCAFELPLDLNSTNIKQLLTVEFLPKLLPDGCELHKFHKWTANIYVMPTIAGAPLERPKWKLRCNRSHATQRHSTRSCHFRRSQIVRRTEEAAFSRECFFDCATAANWRARAAFIDFRAGMLEHVRGGRTARYAHTPGSLNRTRTHRRSILF